MGDIRHAQTAQGVFDDRGKDRGKLCRTQRRLSIACNALSQTLSRHPRKKRALFFTRNEFAKAWAVTSSLFQSASECRVCAVNSVASAIVLGSAILHSRKGTKEVKFV